MGRKPGDSGKKIEYGVQLYAARVQLGLNKKQMVQRLMDGFPSDNEISESMYGNWERGLHMPQRQEVFDRIREIMGVEAPGNEVAMILNGHDERGPAIEVTGELVDEQGQGVVEWSSRSLMQLDLEKASLLGRMSNMGNTVVGVRVVGDSFQPEYNPGDILLVELTENRQEILRDDHLIVTRKGEDLNLFLQYDRKKKALVGLTAETRDQPVVFSRGTLKFVGRVVSMWRMAPGRGGR